MKTIKVILFSLFLAGSLGIIAAMFWEQELKFTKPTPRPLGFVATAKEGDVLSPTQFIAVAQGKPTMLHFFNSNCPCSRFNMQEVAYLVETYGSRVNFVAVLQDKDPKAANDFLEKYNLKMSTILDSAGVVSDYYGVYSTPQAVLLDVSEKIYYKGNYNKARFCNSRKTAFANLAINSLLAGQPLPKFVQQASVPYGCTLPSDVQQPPSFLSSLNIFN